MKWIITKTINSKTMGDLCMKLCILCKLQMYGDYVYVFGKLGMCMQMCIIILCTCMLITL